MDQFLQIWAQKSCQDFIDLILRQFLWLRLYSARKLVEVLVLR